MRILYAWDALKLASGWHLVLLPGPRRQRHNSLIKMASKANTAALAALQKSHREGRVGKERETVKSHCKNNSMQEVFMRNRK